MTEQKNLFVIDTQHDFLPVTGDLCIKGNNPTTEFYSALPPELVSADRPRFPPLLTTEMISHPVFWVR